MRDHADPTAEHHECAGWRELVEYLEAFPSPTLGFDEQNELTSSAWVFRGLAKASFHLEPTIEREAATRAMRWAALELLVSAEFSSRAHMHLGAQMPLQDDLIRLAVMQHHAIPTRLLDFTYSPFVGLYFAIRNNTSRSEAIRLWAIDAQAVNRRFRKVVWQAHVAAEDKELRKVGLPPKSRAVSLDPDSFLTDRDNVAHETHGLEAEIAAALAATGARRRVQENDGCVCVAAPPVFNPRLASQQGLFLLNCAEDLTFRESLTRMMQPHEGWCRTFDVQAGAIPEIEERLFQLNIHEQALFPDIEGLAGFIRQKVRLHWK